MIGVVLAAFFKEIVQGMQERLVIIFQSAGIFVDDVFELRATIHDLDQLIDLLLIFDQGEAGVGVFEDVKHLLGDRILIHRNRNAAVELGGNHGPIKLRPVFTDDRQAVAALKPVGRHAASHGADLLLCFAPGPGLPDAEILFAYRRAIAANSGIFDQ